MKFDPVSLDIVWSRLVGICQEAENGLMRTAFSLLVREMQDMGCVLVDTNGDAVASGWGRGMSVGVPVRNMLKKFPVETLEPGDILITNDPYLGTGHLWDCTVAEPIFHKGKLVALAGSMAHWPDIGGRGLSTENRSLFEEGLQLPIMKIGKKGRINEQVMEIIRQNVRLPDEVTGDFRSQLVANNLIRTRLIELIDTQGITDFGELARLILTRSEAAMRNAIRLAPDGDYENQIWIDGIEQPMTIKAKISVRDTDISVDYSGTSEQSVWCINSPPSYTYSYTYFAIKSIFGPHLPHNSGPMRPLSVSSPLGTILNPRPTVGTAARTSTGIYVAIAVLGALSPAISHQAQAESCTVWPTTFTGIRDNGKSYVARAILSGGMGGRHGKDGISCTYFPPAYMRNPPVEVLENQTPELRIEKRQIRADSGGSGLYRGGCGQQMEFRAVGDRSVSFAAFTENMEFPTQSALGGNPGATGSLLLNGSPIRGKEMITLKEGDLVTLNTPGGGGFGDPLQRDPSQVLSDVVAGMVSPEQAEASYGVRIELATKSVDVKATAEMRRSRRLVGVAPSGISPS